MNMKRARYRITLSVLGAGVTAFVLGDAELVVAALLILLAGVFFFAVGYFLDTMAGIQAAKRDLPQTLSFGMWDSGHISGEPRGWQPPHTQDADHGINEPGFNSLDRLEIVNWYLPGRDPYP